MKNNSRISKNTQDIDVANPKTGSASLSISNWLLQKQRNKKAEDSIQQANISQHQQPRRLYQNIFQKTGGVTRKQQELTQQPLTLLKDVGKIAANSLSPQKKLKVYQTSTQLDNGPKINISSHFKGESGSLSPEKIYKKQLKKTDMSSPNKNQPQNLAGFLQSPSKKNSNSRRKNPSQKLQRESPAKKQLSSLNKNFANLNRIQVLNKPHSLMQHKLILREEEVDSDYKPDAHGSSKQFIRPQTQTHTPLSKNNPLQSEQIRIFQPQQNDRHQIDKNQNLPHHHKRQDSSELRSVIASESNQLYNEQSSSRLSLSALSVTNYNSPSKPSIQQNQMYQQSGSGSGFVTGNGNNVVENSKTEADIFRHQKLVQDHFQSQNSQEEKKKTQISTKQVTTTLAEKVLNYSRQGSFVPQQNEKKFDRTQPGIKHQNNVLSGQLQKDDSDFDRFDPKVVLLENFQSNFNDIRNNIDDSNQSDKDLGPSPLIFQKLNGGAFTAKTSFSSSIINQEHHSTLQAANCITNTPRAQSLSPLNNIDNQLLVTQKQLHMRQQLLEGEQEQEERIQIRMIQLDKKQFPKLSLVEPPATALGPDGLHKLTLDSRPSIDLYSMKTETQSSFAYNNQNNYSHNNIQAPLKEIQRDEIMVVKSGKISQKNKFQQNKSGGQLKQFKIYSTATVDQKQKLGTFDEEKKDSEACSPVDMTLAGSQQSVTSSDAHNSGQSKIFYDQIDENYPLQEAQQPQSDLNQRKKMYINAVNYSQEQDLQELNSSQNQKKHATFTGLSKNLKAFDKKSSPNGVPQSGNQQLNSDNLNNTPQDQMDFEFKKGRKDFLLNSKANQFPFNNFLQSSSAVNLKQKIAFPNKLILNGSLQSVQKGGSEKEKTMFVDVSDQTSIQMPHNLDQSSKIISPHTILLPDKKDSHKVSEQIRGQKEDLKSTINQVSKFEQSTRQHNKMQQDMSNGQQIWQQPPLVPSHGQSQILVTQSSAGMQFMDENEIVFPQTKTTPPKDGDRQMNLQQQSSPMISTTMREKHQKKIPDSHKKRAKQSSQNNRIVGISSHSSVFSYSSPQIQPQILMNSSSKDNITSTPSLSRQSPSTYVQKEIEQDKVVNDCQKSDIKDRQQNCAQNNSQLHQMDQNETPKSVEPQDIENILITFEHQNVTPRQINEFKPHACPNDQISHDGLALTTNTHQQTFSHPYTTKNSEKSRERRKTTFEIQQLPMSPLYKKSKHFNFISDNRVPQSRRKNNQFRVQDQQTPSKVNLKLQELQLDELEQDTEKMLMNSTAVMSTGNQNFDEIVPQFGEIKEFMNELGASKHITQRISNSHFKNQIQLKRRMTQGPHPSSSATNRANDVKFQRMQSPGNHIGINHEKRNSLERQAGSSQNHARKRQISMSNHQMQRPDVKQLIHEDLVKSPTDKSKHSQHTDFKCNEFQLTTSPKSGDLKLKILKRDAIYLPRQILQEKQIFEKVTILDISSCEIVELEGRIFMQLRNMTKLLAARNQIKYLSSRIGDCQKLEVINLDSNCLEMLPSEIGKLQSSLRVLKISNNRLKQLTLRVRDLQRLEILNLEQNLLQELPENICLKNLTQLHISDNKLTHFNVLIARMPKLTKITLDWFSMLVPPQSETVIKKSSVDYLTRQTDKINHENVQTFLENHEKSSKLQQQSGRSKSVVRLQPTHSKKIQNDIDLTLGMKSEIYNVDYYHQQQKDQITLSRQNSEDDLNEQISCQNNKGQQILPSVDLFKELAVLTESTYGISRSGFEDSSAAKKMSQVKLDFCQFSRHFSKIFNPQLHNNDSLSQKSFSSNYWIDHCDSKKKTMLHYAAQKGQIAVIKSLLENGASKTMQDQYRFNPYGLAMREEHFQAAWILLTDPNFAYQNIRQGAGTFPSLVHLATSKLQPDHVQVFLDHIRPAELKSIFEQSPLHTLMTVFSKNSPKASQIFESLQQFGIDLNVLNSDGLSPLHIASKRGSLPACQALIQAGFISAISSENNKPVVVNINMACKLDGRSSLHFASDCGHYHIVDYLIEKGADVFQRDFQGKNPLAGVSNNLLMIKMLKKAQNRVMNNKFERNQELQESCLTSKLTYKSSQITNEKLLRDCKVFQPQKCKYVTFGQTLKNAKRYLNENFQNNFAHDDSQVVTLPNSKFEKQQTTILQSQSFKNSRQNHLTFQTNQTQTQQVQKEDEIAGVNVTTDAISIASDDLDENTSKVPLQSLGNILHTKLTNQRSSRERAISVQPRPPIFNQEMSNQFQEFEGTFQIPSNQKQLRQQRRMTGGVKSGGFSGKNNNELPRQTRSVIRNEIKMTQPIRKKSPAKSTTNHDDLKIDKNIVVEKFGKLTLSEAIDLNKFSQSKNHLLSSTSILKKKGSQISDLQIGTKHNIPTKTSESNNNDDNLNLGTQQSLPSFNTEKHNLPGEQKQVKLGSWVNRQTIQRQIPKQTIVAQVGKERKFDGNSEEQKEHSTEFRKHKKLQIPSQTLMFSGKEMNNFGNFKALPQRRWTDVHTAGKRPRTRIPNQQTFAPRIGPSIDQVSHMAPLPQKGRKSMVLAAKNDGVLSNGNSEVKEGIGSSDQSQQTSNMISASKNLFKESEPPDYPSDSLSESNFQADFQDQDLGKPLCSQVDSMENHFNLKNLKPVKKQSQEFQTKNYLSQKRQAIKDQKEAGLSLVRGQSEQQYSQKLFVLPKKPVNNQNVQILANVITKSKNLKEYSPKHISQNNDLNGNSKAISNQIQKKNRAIFYDQQNEIFSSTSSSSSDDDTEVRDSDTISTPAVNLTTKLTNSNTFLSQQSGMVVLQSDQRNSQGLLINQNQRLQIGAPQNSQHSYIKRVMETQKGAVNQGEIIVNQNKFDMATNRYN